MVVQVRHTEENTLVLRGMGFDCPAPIEVYYDFRKVKAKFTPFNHQVEAASFGSLHKRSHLLLPLGCGKSYTSASIADYLIGSKQIKSVLILCPLSCMSPVWEEELRQGFPDRTYQILHGTTKQRVERLNTQSDFYIANHAFIQVAIECKTVRDRQVYSLRPEFSKLNDVDLIIFDESSMLRNAKTHLWNGMKLLLKPHVRYLPLSGFPCPSSPENAWSQSMLVAPNNTPKFFSHWRSQVCWEEKKGQFSKWHPKKGSEKDVFNLMQPAFHVDKSKVLDLPPMVVERRQVEMSKEQKTQYSKMHNEMVMQFQELGCKVDATNAADKFLKLRQVLIGSVKSAEGEYVDFQDVPRIKTVLEIIEQSQAKVVVISPFTGGLRMITAAIEKSGVSVGFIDGSVNVKDRDALIKNFQETNSPRVIVANGKAISHGVTLTAASTMIFLGPVTGNDQYQQLLGRLNRVGQVNHMVVFQLYANTLEAKMYDSLENDQNYQESVMELYRQECEGGV